MAYLEQNLPELHNLRNLLLIVPCQSFQLILVHEDKLNPVDFDHALVGETAKSLADQFADGANRIGHLLQDQIAGCRVVLTATIALQQ